MDTIKKVYAKLREHYLKYKSSIQFYWKALISLFCTAIFSIMPIAAGLLLLALFGKWDGDWMLLLKNGDLLMASTGLMATASVTFFSTETRSSFMKSISGLGAVVIIAFSTLVYAGLTLSSFGILADGTKVVPTVLVSVSILLYFGALGVGYYALLLEQKPIPSNLDIREEQVSELERQFNEMGGGQ